MGGRRVFGILAQRVEQSPDIEDINAHGSAYFGRIEYRTHGTAMPRLLLESDDPEIFVDLAHTEALRLVRIDLDGGDRDVGLAAAMAVDHVAVIHLVDVVGGKHQRIFAALGGDRGAVLEDCVGGAEIPIVAQALHGRDHLDVFADFGGEDVPSVANVTDELEGLVLCQNKDTPHAGVDAVG